MAVLWFGARRPNGVIIWNCYASGKAGAPAGATLKANPTPAECRS